MSQEPIEFGGVEMMSNETAELTVDVAPKVQRKGEVWTDAEALGGDKMALALHNYGKQLLGTLDQVPQGHRRHLGVSEGKQFDS